jgi:hypothetical protein
MSRRIPAFMPFLFLFFIAVLICASSCAGLKGAGGEERSAAESRPFVFLTDTSKFILLPPEAIEKPMDSHQLVTAFFQGREFMFNAWVKADETGLDMFIFNELGASGGELSYRNGAVSFSSPLFPQSIKPEYIVADFQLCFYDAVLLGRALETCGLTLEIKGTGRRILKGKTVIIEIEKAMNEVRLVNHLRGYIYTLEGEFE